MNQEARTKLVKARIAMIMQQPFFGTLALRLRLVENDKLNPPTLAVDGKTMYYHPQWVLDNDHDVCMSGVAHEVGHCVFQHIGRRNGREPRRWNHAGDYVINAVLKDSGFTVPPTWLHSPTFAGMSTDQVYQALPPDPPGDAFDGIADAPPADTDPQINADDWQIAAVQAANVAAAAGNLPGSLKRFVDEIVNGKVDWRAVLRRFVTDDARDDYSYRRVNRKYAALGIFLPGLYSEAMGAMVSVIDTSGSISDEILAEFGGEISAIHATMQPSSLVNIYCDADVNHVDTFDRYDTPKFEGHGGGGTDFRPPFRWIEEKQIEPKCLIYLTDGYGPFPAEPPPYPVLWVMTTDVQPPWGEVVRIEL